MVREGRAMCYCALCGGKKISWRVRSQHMAMVAAQSQLEEVEAISEEASVTSISNCVVASLPDNASDSPETTNLLDRYEDEIDEHDSEESGEMEYNDNDTSDHEDDCEIFDEPVPTTSLFTSYDMEHLDGISEWQIEDKELREAIHWLIWKVEHGVSDTAFANRPSFQDDDTGNLPPTSMSLYRLKKAVKRLSGLSPWKVPCCVNVCKAFYENEQTCPHCNEDVYETLVLASGESRRARKHMFYFSPIPRLLIEWADSSLAEEMKVYVEFAKRRPDGLAADFWSSGHFKSISHLFQDPRTVSFTLGGDGVNITRQQNHTVWPFCLTNNNYPPELRFQQMMIVLLVPGPKEAVDMASFCKPLMDDLELLKHGISALDGSLPRLLRLEGRQFTLKAYLCIITGDTPAIAKFMGMRGSNSISPCRFCRLSGELQSSTRHYYYPLNGRVLVAKEPSHATDNEIPLRISLRNEIRLVNAANREDLRQIHGINGTVHWPNSFGLDIMHLFSNVSKMVWRIWTGNLLPRPAFDEDEGETFLISAADQSIIGARMARSRTTVPVFVSRTPRDISKHMNSFKATEWFEFTMIYSLPLLRDILPDYALHNWIYFVEALRLAVQVELTAIEVQRLEECLRLFVTGMEDIYYQGHNSRLQCCTSQVHGLLHLTQSINALGPSFVFWQFGLERFVGTLEALASSKSQMNVSMYNGLELREHLRYIITLYRLPKTTRSKRPASGDNIATESGIDLGYFAGKSTQRQMSAPIHRMLVDYYNNLDPHAVLTRDDVPVQYHHFNRLIRKVAVGSATEFAVTTSEYSGERRRNYIAFRDIDNANQSVTSYGRVLSFVQHHMYDGSRCLSLALIKPLQTVVDPLTEQIFFEREGRGSMLIDVVEIVGPVGVIDVQSIEHNRAIARHWIAQGYRCLVPA